MSNLHQQLPQGYEESISVPINQLIQSRRNMISASRNYAVRASGNGGGAPAGPISRQSNINRYIADPVSPVPHRSRQAIDADNNNNNNINNINIINNIYYYPDYINSENIINSHDQENDAISSQEQNDIEEAIRRSLE
jgi:hypothetical protein